VLFFIELVSWCCGEKNASFQLLMVVTLRDPQDPCSRNRGSSNSNLGILSPQYDFKLRIPQYKVESHRFSVFGILFSVLSYSLCHPKHTAPSFCYLKHSTILGGSSRILEFQIEDPKSSQADEFFVWVFLSWHRGEGKITSRFGTMFGQRPRSSSR
jgi:hypothetical protein